jgi:nitrogen fixation protein NifU and related proteins
MNTELADLYRDLVLDHGRSPRNFRILACPSRTADGYNPLCGDQIHLGLRLEGEQIEEIGFQGSGCAISRASASLMTQAVRGMTAEQARRLLTEVHLLLTEGPEAAADLAALGKLAALSGVWQFPARVKCASLAWHTLRSALEGSGAAVSTE